jgi:hypothetical protein
MPSATTARGRNAQAPRRSNEPLVFHVASGEWVFDYRCCCGAPRYWFNCFVHLPAGFFNKRRFF